MTRLDGGGNKYRAKRTYSALCGREFASKAEAHRGEELALLQKGGVISNLQYQVPFRLSYDPKITVTIDFGYTEDGKPVYEDTKGVMTRDFRTKLAWLKQVYHVTVKITQ